MKPNANHIKQIKVISNTHWDREFRRSFEKTRRRLLTMLDVTLDILEKDKHYHSFTMDGHCIMIDDYLEMRPERRKLVETLVAGGRLILGPYYTLAEEFSICHEALVRNLMWGRKTINKYGGKTGTVAYTPSSWGQTGQLPQILNDFGLKYMMFYRGISHHECDAEFTWQSPDGTAVTGNRFALYARYNWYYQVHRMVSRGTAFDKKYVWGAYDEVPLRPADGSAGEDLAFDLKDPQVSYDKSVLKKAILDMVAAEGAHFTTPVFLAMNGHDISVAWPLESTVIRDAQEALKGTYTIEHTDLEEFWRTAEKHIDHKKLPVLTGERRSYLKEGKWTFLFPATVSARTYLKQQDFAAYTRLTYYAEPLACLSSVLGEAYPVRYLERGWGYLLSNHTHDANGGCAPDVVCKDMEYRYRKVVDIGDIVCEDAMAHVAKNLSPKGLDKTAMQLIVFNPLPFERDSVMMIDCEIPRTMAAKSFSVHHGHDKQPALQPLSSEKSSSFVDSIWEVPTILESNRIKQYVKFSKLPALGYRAYTLAAQPYELRQSTTLVTGHNTMENSLVAVTVNSDATITITNKKTGKTYHNANYLSDQGECGNAWKHASPVFDRIYTSKGVAASVAVTCSGPLVSTISADFQFAVPRDYGNGQGRSEIMTAIPVQVEYRLEKDSPFIQVKLTLNNTALDHWLRVNVPTGLKTGESVADSHYDIVRRPIAIPDSQGWVEQAMGTHPLRTFVGLSDGKNGIALMPKGIYEYEAFDDKERTLALTLIRACRIKLAVSEEKQTELPDAGVQCGGTHLFEYALVCHSGSTQQAGLCNLAAQYFAAPHAIQTGRGKGTLPLESSLFTINNTDIHVSCVKRAEDQSGIIIRLFNPLEKSCSIRLSFGKTIKRAAACTMDENEIKKIPTLKSVLAISVGAKKIQTVKIVL